MTDVAMISKLPRTQSSRSWPQAFGCPKRVSAIAILDHGGAEDQYARLLALAEQGRAAWQALHADLASGCGRPPHAPPLLGGLLPQVRTGFRFRFRDSAGPMLVGLVYQATWECGLFMFTMC